MTTQSVDGVVAALRRVVLRRFTLYRAALYRAALCAAAVLAPAPLAAQHLLVPMDDAQQDHLRAYGLAYQVLTDGGTVEWLLNYRGGAFVLPDLESVRRRAGLAGVTVAAIDGGALATVKTEVESVRGDVVPLEKAPKIAVYTPPGTQPWDDAVTLALKYAGIEYVAIYDEEVLAGDLSKYEWLHLHHEDFTGQLNKFYISYRDAPWFRALADRDAATAAKLGFANPAALKKEVAERVRQFVERGGFLFAMCGATETLELAIAARNVDIAAAFADGTPADPAASARMDWARTPAFRNVQLETSPLVNSMSSIDGHQVNVPGRRQPLGTFTLFGFAAQHDPVATMLVQNHRSVLTDFYGVTTSFTTETIKPGVTVLATEEGAPWAKYIHGTYGQGTWTYYGGHDPEDPQHAIGSPPTDLALHRNSPGYRLILNNVLFPAAKKKPRKT